jgi:hypothetical protein
MGNKPSKPKTDKKPAVQQKQKQQHLDPVECGYLYRDDPIPINLDKYAALKSNYDDFDSNGTVLASAIETEARGRRTYLYAIVIPSARVLIVQEKHVFIGNPWRKNKYNLYNPSYKYNWTVGMSTPNTHDPNVLSSQLGYRYHGKDDTKYGNLQEFLEAYQSGTCTGLVVRLGPHDSDYLATLAKR